MMSPSSANLDYFLETATEDYYGIQSEPDGYWVGVGAEKLDLYGLVKTDEVRNIANGFSPDGKESLVQQQNHSGRKRQPGWDLTFNAPKSVSVLWALSKPETQSKIQLAQEKAVRTAFQHIEDFGAFTRRKKGGQIEHERVHLIAAGFEHCSSRNLDPHLHTHLVVFNVGVRNDGTTGTILSKPFWDMQKVAGAIYRLELAKEIKNLEVDQLRKGNNSFELLSVPDSVAEDWSTRRAEILQAEKELGEFSPKVRDIIAHNTRDEKQIVSREVLTERWKKQATENEFVVQTTKPEKIHERVASSLAAKAVDESIDWLAGRQSHFTQDDVIIRAALKVEHVGVPVQVIYDEYQEKLYNKKLVYLGSELEKIHITSHENFEAEKELVELVRNNKESISVKTQNWKSPGVVVDELVQQASKEARPIRFTSMSATGAANTAQSYQVNSMTIAKLLKDDSIPNKSTIVAQEARAFGTHDLVELIKFTEKTNSRLCFLESNRRLNYIGPKGGLELVKRELESNGHALPAPGNRLPEKTDISSFQTKERAIEEMVKEWVQNYEKKFYQPINCPDKMSSNLINYFCQLERLKQGQINKNASILLGSGERAYKGDIIRFGANFPKWKIQSGLEAEVKGIDSTDGKVWIQTTEEKFKISVRAFKFAELGYSNTDFNLRELDNPQRFLLIDLNDNKRITTLIDQKTKIFVYSSGNGKLDSDQKISKRVQERLTNHYTWTPKSATIFKEELDNRSAQIVR